MAGVVQVATDSKSDCHHSFIVACSPMLFCSLLQNREDHPCVLQLGCPFHHAPIKLSELSKAVAVIRDAPYLQVVAVGSAALNVCSIHLGVWTSISESVSGVRPSCRVYDSKRTTRAALCAVSSLWGPGLVGFSFAFRFLPALFQMIACRPISLSSSACSCLIGTDVLPRLIQSTMLLHHLPPSFLCI